MAKYSLHNHIIRNIKCIDVSLHLLLTHVYISLCRLILGMMITSAFLSMWLSNTATTAMMLPIANAILESLFGDLATLKENCKVKDETEGELLCRVSPTVPHTSSEKMKTYTIAKSGQI